MAYWLVGDAPEKETGPSNATRVTEIGGFDRAERTLTPDDTGLPNLANRLLNLSGWTIGEFLSIFEVRTTVWKKPWPKWICEGRHRKIAEEAKDADGVVLVGHLCAEAFGVPMDPFEWHGKYAVVPNPAPTRLTRYWNAPGMKDRARGFFDGLREQHRARKSPSGAANKRQRPSSLKGCSEHDEA